MGYGQEWPLFPGTQTPHVIPDSPRVKVDLAFSPVTPPLTRPGHRGEGIGVPLLWGLLEGKMVSCSGRSWELDPSPPTLDPGSLTHLGPPGRWETARSFRGPAPGSDRTCHGPCRGSPCTLNQTRDQGRGLSEVCESLLPAWAPAPRERSATVWSGWVTGRGGTCLLIIWYRPSACWALEALCSDPRGGWAGVPGDPSKAWDPEGCTLLCGVSPCVGQATGCLSSGDLPRSSQRAWG